jgi:hypothetical protein
MPEEATRLVMENIAKYGARLFSMRDADYARAGTLLIRMNTPLLWLFKRVASRCVSFTRPFLRVCNS